MHFYSVYNVEFDHEQKELYLDVKAASSEDAKGYIRRFYSGAQIVSVTNLTREDAINKFVQLLLSDVSLLRNPEMEKPLKKAISAFAAVTDTEYHHYIKDYPTDSIVTIAKKVFKQMNGGNKTF